ncbi:MAG: helix-turn-helix transcriptional regulator [Actinomycetota bacterium]|nr:helix-turn-helix transcriptional regulator [Actinomycetota bacterium]
MRPSEKDRKEVGARIREIRERRGMTQRELAERSGMTESAMRSYELGYRMPSEAQVRLMAKALGVRPEAFADCKARSYVEVVHLLFHLEGDLGIAPIAGEAAVRAGKRGSAIELALIDWGEKRAELEAGEITQEEYEDWKDSYSPGKQVKLPVDTDKNL